MNVAHFQKQEMSSHGPHDDVLEKTYGNLIDIPSSEPSHPEPPKHTDGGDHASSDSKQNTMNSFDLLGDVHDPKPVPTVPEQQPTHVYDHYHGTHDEAPFEPVGRGGVPLDQLIEDQVAEVHGDVDEVLHRMQETDEYKLPEPKEEEHHRHKEDRYTHRDDDSDSDQPDFRSQTPDAEESTFNRRGPLTIPEVPETHPRPPTPPKDISEELVKPSAFSLAPQHTPTHSHHDGLHSILKPSSSHYGAAEPWFDFKTVDPHSES
ncbi:unnamed protein product [Heligmosomoides polygyrus]|uniref:Surface protein n=1 Tax=Heligmosomoides polygyrus TaxID=6339 RepID=A0A183FHR4_HELPZ|nr:unnamed protein product [Heligmosomoides polygyrus]